MTKNLLKTPRYWLNLVDCENLFQNFKSLLAQEEPIPPFNQRFEGKLEGILGSVCQTFNGMSLNKTVLDAAAAYFNQFVRGHAFENGNKRCAVLYTHWFLLANGVEFTLTAKEMYAFAVAVAKAGEKNINAETTKQWCKEIINKFTNDRKII
jgi:death-on-curing family protein